MRTKFFALALVAILANADVSPAAITLGNTYGDVTITPLQGGNEKVTSGTASRFEAELAPGKIMRGGQNLDSEVNADGDLTLRKGTILVQTQRAGQTARVMVGSVNVTVQGTALIESGQTGIKIINLTGRTTVIGAGSRQAIKPGQMIFQEIDNREVTEPVFIDLELLHESSALLALFKDPEKPDNHKNMLETDRINAAITYQNQRKINRQLQNTPLVILNKENKVVVGNKQVFDMTELRNSRNPLIIATGQEMGPGTGTRGPSNNPANTGGIPNTNASFEIRARGTGQFTTVDANQSLLINNTAGAGANILEGTRVAGNVTDAAARFFGTNDTTKADAGFNQEFTRMGDTLVFSAKSFDVKGHPQIKGNPKTVTLKGEKITFYPTVNGTFLGDGGNPNDNNTDVNWQFIANTITFNPGTKIFLQDLENQGEHIGGITQNKNISNVPDQRWTDKSLLPAAGNSLLFYARGPDADLHTGGEIYARDVTLIATRDVKAVDGTIATDISDDTIVRTDALRIHAGRNATVSGNNLAQYLFVSAGNNATVQAGLAWFMDIEAGNIVQVNMTRNNKHYVKTVKLQGEKIIVTGGTGERGVAGTGSFTFNSDSDYSGGVQEYRAGAGGIDTTAWDHLHATLLASQGDVKANTIHVSGSANIQGVTNANIFTVRPSSEYNTITTPIVSIGNSPGSATPSATFEKAVNVVRFDAYQATINNSNLNATEGVTGYQVTINNGDVIGNQINVYNLIADNITAGTLTTWLGSYTGFGRIPQAPNNLDEGILTANAPNSPAYIQNASVTARETITADLMHGRKFTAPNIIVGMGGVRGLNETPWNPAGSLSAGLAKTSLFTTEINGTNIKIDGGIDVGIKGDAGKATAATPSLDPAAGFYGDTSKELLLHRVSNAPAGLTTALPAPNTNKMGNDIIINGTDGLLIGGENSDNGIAYIWNNNARTFIGNIQEIDPARETKFASTVDGPAGDTIVRAQSDILIKPIHSAAANPYNRGTIDTNTQGYVEVRSIAGKVAIDNARVSGGQGSVPTWFFPNRHKDGAPWEVVGYSTDTYREYAGTATNYDKEHLPVRFPKVVIESQKTGGNAIEITNGSYLVASLNGTRLDINNFNQRNMQLHGTVELKSTGGGDILIKDSTLDAGSVSAEYNRLVANGASVTAVTRIQKGPGDSLTLHFANQVINLTSNESRTLYEDMLASGRYKPHPDGGLDISNAVGYFVIEQTDGNNQTHYNFVFSDSGSTSERMLAEDGTPLAIPGTPGLNASSIVKVTGNGNNINIDNSHLMATHMIVQNVRPDGTITLRGGSRINGDQTMQMYAGTGNGAIQVSGGNVHISSNHLTMAADRITVDTGSNLAAHGQTLNVYANQRQYNNTGFGGFTHNGTPVPTITGVTSSGTNGGAQIHVENLNQAPPINLSPAATP
jgi:hypothetical protein